MAKRILVVVFALLTMGAQAFSQSVSGKVSDASGATPGVNVFIKGTTTGTMTDADGNYSLSGVNSSSVLVFSSIGYLTQEITVGSQKVINVFLKEDAETLDEIVVVGYGTQKKSSLTSSITAVDTKKLNERTMPVLANALQGLTPGVEIRQASGRPGYSTNAFDIRGSSRSTFSSNSPLVIVDGLVGGIESVNPNDVENISVLKDAAAASIYGARATGGVILITTKKGSAGKVSVNYNGTYGVETNPLGRLKNHFLSTQDWMRAYNEGSVLDGAAPIYSDAQIAEYNGTDPDKPAYSTWLDWCRFSSPVTSQNISVRGGNDKIRAYAAVGYMWQDGILPNDDYKRYNGQFNLDWNVTKKLEANLTFSYRRQNISRPNASVSTGVLRPILNAPNIPAYWSNGNAANGTLGNGPYLCENGGNSLTNSDAFRINADLKYEIIPGLNLKYNFGTTISYSSTNTFYATYLKPTGSFSDTPVITTLNNRTTPEASESWSASHYISHLVTLDYAKKFGKNHDFYAMVGFQSEENKDDSINAYALGFVNNSLRKLAATTGTGTDINGSGSGSDWAMASFIGRLTYNYAEKYLLEVTARYDGSSRFSSANRWALFPAVSAAWRINNENFMKNADWLSNLKLRASWGQLGNQGSSLYPFAALVSFGTWYFGNGASKTASLGTVPSPSLSWETKSTVNLGLDYGFFNQRLTGSFDWFKDRTKDILATPTVPTTYGASAPVQNVYVVDNRGWEFVIRWADRIGDFNYEVGFNMADARDKVVSLGELGSYDKRYCDGEKKVVISGDTYYGEGSSMNSLYYYHDDGLFVDQAELDSWKATLKNTNPFTNTKPGDIKFLDNNGDGEINSNDRFFSNLDSNPHYIYGFNLGGSWKGFDLSLVFNGVLQRYTFRNRDGHYMTGNRLHFSLIDSNYENRWTPENPDKYADQPRLTLNNWISNDFSPCLSAATQYHLRNLGYLRLKNLQFGYTIPQKFTQKFKIAKLRVYFSGENLFYIAPGYTEYMDPESFWTTGDSSSSVYYGPSKSYTGGISITF